jgi:hypothetical protein
MVQVQVKRFRSDSRGTPRSDAEHREVDSRHVTVGRGYAGKVTGTLPPSEQTDTFAAILIPPGIEQRERASAGDLAVTLLEPGTLTRANRWLVIL